MISVCWKCKQPRIPTSQKENQPDKEEKSAEKESSSESEEEFHLFGWFFLLFVNSLLFLWFLFCYTHLPFIPYLPFSSTLQWSWISASLFHFHPPFVDYSVQHLFSIHSPCVWSDLNSSLDSHSIQQPLILPMAETHLHQIFIPSFPQSDWTIKRRNYLKTSIS